MKHQRTHPQTNQVLKEVLEYLSRSIYGTHLKSCTIQVSKSDDGFTVLELYLNTDLTKGGKYDE